MFNKNISALLFIIIISFCLPFTTSAFWWFNQTPAIQNQAPIENNTLDDKAKIELSNKYQIWVDGFEKKDIESVITNSEKYIFTIPELNYLFETETQKIKNPSISNVLLTKDNDNIKVTANFHKFINGHFSFDAHIVSVENKIRLELSSVSLYGFPIPSKWLANEVNKELDNYFSFLYKSDKYNGFSFIVNNDSLQLKPEFIK
jgi:hypothetical protein